MLYMTISHGASSYFLFLFLVLEKKVFLPYLSFFSLWVRGTLVFFVLVLFELQAQSAPYHPEIFYNMAFFSPMLEHILYKINNYMILKHVVERYLTRQFNKSTDTHTHTGSFVGYRILEL